MSIPKYLQSLSGAKPVHFSAGDTVANFASGDLISLDQVKEVFSNLGITTDDVEKAKAVDSALSEIVKGSPITDEAYTWMKDNYPLITAAIDEDAVDEDEED